MFVGHWAARRCGMTQGKEGRRGEREFKRRTCHGEGSQRAGGEQRCLGDDCRCSRWSEPFSLTYTPGLTQTETGGGSGDGGGDGFGLGCRARALVITRDLLPVCLLVCLNAALCHLLQTRDCVLTKQRHKQDHMHTDTHTQIHMHRTLRREREG